MRQSQRGADDSTNLQAGRDLTMNFQGVTSGDVIDIADSCMKRISRSCRHRRLRPPHSALGNLLKAFYRK